jgi:glutathione S-transferase
MAGVLADTARANVRKYLELVDTRLRGRDWLVDTRSICDPYLFVMLRWARRVGIDASGLDNVARYFERMQADRGVRAALTSQEGVQQ